MINNKKGNKKSKAKNNRDMINIKEEGKRPFSH